MFAYKVCFFESSVSVVKTGQCMPFETFQTSSYENARKSCLEFTTDDYNCSAVLINQQTGNRIYFQAGQEKSLIINISFSYRPDCSYRNNQLEPIGSF